MRQAHAQTIVNRLRCGEDQNATCIVVARRHGARSRQSMPWRLDPSSTKGPKELPQS